VSAIAAVVLSLILAATAAVESSSMTGVAQAAGDPLIAAAGDIACDPTVRSPDPAGSNPGYCQHRATSDLLVGQPLTAVLPLGDLQYERGALAAFQQSYDSTWGRVKAVTRPVPGNHEYQTSGAAGYFDYFGTAAGSRANGYYSFTLGSWHVVALNSNCAVVSCGAGSTQEQWLRSDLAAHPASCTLAYFHHPYLPVDQSDEPQVGALWQALYDAHADVVLNGHEHNYQRYAPQDPGGRLDRSNGIRQFVVGTGGKNHVDSPSASNREVYFRDGFGVLLLTLHDGSYDWRFAGTHGESVDSGSASCVPATSPPATSAPPSASPSTAGCGDPATVRLEPTVITAGQRATVHVQAGAQQGVELWAYTRPSTAYRQVRTGRTDAAGEATFTVLPAANTRLYAVASGCAPGPSAVLGVRTALSIDATRVGRLTYVFSGDSTPARPGGLVVSLYRVTAEGRQVLTAQTRADGQTGQWSIRRVFSGTGTFGFVVRTGADLQNAPGTSRVRRTLVY
jgi:hypothetical protein